MRYLNKRILIGSLLAAGALQAMACYTVYDRSNRIMYQGERPPVDMSLPIHETLATRYPGGHMVFDTSVDCQALASARLAPVPGGTPLFTNQQTARSMNVPYTALAGGIALIRPEATAVRPGLTVVPPTTFAAARRNGDSTRMMGAGAAPRR